MEFSGPENWSGQPFPSPGDIPNSETEPGINPEINALQVDSLPAEPQGKPRNTGVDSLSVLQQIFLTQESNQGLLHCRWIHYQLSYQGKTKIYGLMVCTCLSVCKAAFVEYKIPLISLSFGSFETHVFWWFMIRRQSISCMVEWGLYLEVSVL